MAAEKALEVALVQVTDEPAHPSSIGSWLLVALLVVGWAFVAREMREDA